MTRKTEHINLPHEDAKHIACKLLGHRLCRCWWSGSCMTLCLECEAPEYQAYKAARYGLAYGGMSNRTW